MKNSSHNVCSQIDDQLRTEQYDGILDDPRRIFTLNEYALYLHSTEKLVLSLRGRNKFCGERRNEDSMSFALSYNAHGECPPLMITFKKSRPSELSASSEVFLTQTPTGWMDAETFFEFVSTKLLPWIQTKDIPLPIALFLDPWQSRLSLQLAEFCKSNGILLVALPKRVQSLNSGVTNALETMLEKQRLLWKTNNDVQKINFANAVDFVNGALAELQENESPEQNVFQACGELKHFKSHPITGVIKIKIQFIHRFASIAEICTFQQCMPSEK